MEPTEALERALELLSISKADLARGLGVTPQTVSQWCSGTRPIPPVRAVAIEKLTGGRISRGELCPQFPWDKAA